MNTTGFCFATVFTYCYAILIGFAIVASIAVPITKTKNYFRFIAFIFAVLTVTAFVGIVVFMS